MTANMAKHTRARMIRFWMILWQKRKCTQSLKVHALCKIMLHFEGKAITQKSSYSIMMLRIDYWVCKIVIWDTLHLNILTFVP